MDISACIKSEIRRSRPAEQVYFVPIHVGIADRKMIPGQSTPAASSESEASELIERALKFHKQGDLDEAARLYQTILGMDASHFEARHMLGAVKLQRGQLDEAIVLISGALQSRPGSVHALRDAGFAFLLAHRFDESVFHYSNALAIQADDVDALFQRGNALAALGRYDEALADYDKAVALEPGLADALAHRGKAALALNRGDEAIASLERALLITPDLAEARHDLGRALAFRQRHDEAIICFDAVLALHPTAHDVLANRGKAALALNRSDEAIANLEQALVIKPDFVEALHDLGRALASQQRYDEAIVCFDGVLTFRPDAYDALNDRGNAFRAMGQHDAAIASYDAAILKSPQDPALYYNRGILRLSLNFTQLAIEDFDKALAVKPDYAKALVARAHACIDLKRFDDAAKSYLEAYSLDPQLPFLMGYLAHARAHLCDWSEYDQTVQRLVEGARSGRPVCVPFAFLLLSDDPAAQLMCATSCVRLQHSKVRPQISVGRKRAHDRIRLGYLSGNFHDHAATYLIAELFESHDRSRFEITGISFGPESRGLTPSRPKANADRFIDVRAMSDADVATLLRDLEIDIAIDMMGHTLDARLDIFAYRPAPIQVNYLGYTGTTGASFIDYIIADHFVVPAGEDAHYSERVVRLPECFQVTNSTSPVAERTPSRAELGLPERGFVFCCFNSSLKIAPGMFDIWMRLLDRVDGSVLWLLRSNASAERNLRRETQKRGVAPDRLIFAPMVPMDQYQAQHRVADLFLDTLPYNAHTTAGYALWAGLPVLTCPGKSFAARVAGSQLHTLHMPELMTGSLEEYEARALELATNPVLLAGIRQKLAGAVVGAPLFHADRYRRHLEAAYVTMWEMYGRGEKPRSFDVARVLD